MFDFFCASFCTQGERFLVSSCTRLSFFSCCKFSSLIGCFCGAHYLSIICIFSLRFWCFLGLPINEFASSLFTHKSALPFLKSSPTFWSSLSMDLHQSFYPDQFFNQYPHNQCRKYYSEYICGTKSQRFRLLYYFDYYGRIPNSFRFIDPVGNEFEVAVFEKNNRLYLSSGSEIIGHYYGLIDGALLTLFSFNASTFYMRLEDQSGNEVLYPTPPAKFSLGDRNAPINVPDDEAPAQQPPYQHSEANFYNSLYKNLSPSDVSSGHLSMPFGFCHLAFPPATAAVKLVDQSGKTWDCMLEWNTEASVDCKLLGGWLNFCNKQKLKQGAAVKLGVSKDDPGFIYFMLM